MTAAMLSYRELQQKLHSSALEGLAILPIGCYEQHGPVLPLDTDNLIAEHAARRLAPRLEGYEVHVFPCLPYTTTEPNVNYAGTVSVAADPFRAYLREVCRGILNTGFEALVLLNSHGSIVGSLKEIAFELVMQQYRLPGVERVRPVLALNVFDFDAQIAEEFEQPVGRHADWKEFLLLYDILSEDYFDQERLQRLRAFAQNHDFEDPMPKVIGIPAELRTTDGVQGLPLPRQQDYPALGARVWEITLDNLVRVTRQGLEQFHSYSHREH